MAAAISCILYHVCNDHSKCGFWCGYTGGFSDPQLFAALKDIFEKLSRNVDKFASAASTNANKSLMASIALKSRCYSTASAADN